MILNQKKEYKIKIGKRARQKEIFYKQKTKFLVFWGGLKGH